MKKHGSDVLTLRGRRFPVQLADVPQSKLLFYLENPRLYTVTRGHGREPTQEEVEERLGRMDHVKQLVLSIRENGGLIDAIIVQGGSNIVLEGNSRLAAYRLLAKADPIKWGYIKAKILPEDIGESEIFALLGEYHIIGKKDWAPFEQAGYLYRRHTAHDVSIKQLAVEINLSVRKISHLIEVYKFMLDQKERDLNRWSYYDEYLKSTIIGKARQTFSGLDEIVVQKIKSGEIPRAVDVRDDLKRVAEAGGKILERFATGKKTFGESVQAAQHKGIGDHGVRHVKKFKEWLAIPESQAEMATLEGEPKKECLYELKKTAVLVARMIKKLEAN